jgi:mannose/fructose/N-acetylgalactosamine-specific phosphotransferase system component IID
MAQTNCMLVKQCSIAGECFLMLPGLTDMYESDSKHVLDNLTQHYNMEPEPCNVCLVSHHGDATPGV